MARTLSTTLKYAVNSVNLNGEVPLLALEFTHSNGGPIRVVHNNEDITSNGFLYKTMPFACNLLDERQGELASLQIGYYDIDLELTTLIRSITNGEPIAIKGHIFLASEPNVEQVTPWNWLVLDASWNADRALGLTAGPRTIRRSSFPFYKFDPGKFPGIFGGTTR